MSVVIEQRVASPPRRSDVPRFRTGESVPARQVRALPLTATDRLPLLDLLRAVSAHVIVWHHLLIYGPLSEAAMPLFPMFAEFLIEHGRNAVQVFLVIGGFVTANSLSKRQELRMKDAWAIIRRRYVRIAGPYLAVLLIAVFANWLAARWMDDESVSAFPTIPQFLAHTVFLHDILGYEALSAGVWYLAIDFQLGLLALALWWLSQRIASVSRVSPLVAVQFLIWPLAGASLFWFNRDPQWDLWAWFFFGSFALGLIASWTVSQKLPRWSFWLYAGLMALALAWEFRPRLAVGLATGLVVFASGCSGWLAKFPTSRVIQFAGASSYSLFLIHFPVCLLVNAWLSQTVPGSPRLSLLGLWIAYGLSVLASIAFYFGVERMFQQERAARRVPC